MTKKNIEDYIKKHKYCPVCHSSSERFFMDEPTTILGYITVNGNIVDPNTCQCADCGNIHKVNNRISLRDIRLIKLKI